MHATNLIDVCTYLWWHHRANRLARHFPLSTLEYESLYTARSRFVRDVLDNIAYLPRRNEEFIMPESNAIPSCGPAKVKDRDMEVRNGHVMPGYLNMYDAAMVKRIAKEIHKYLRESKGLTSPLLQTCGPSQVRGINHPFFFTPYRSLRESNTQNRSRGN